MRARSAAASTATALCARAAWSECHEVVKAASEDARNARRVAMGGMIHGLIESHALLLGSGSLLAARPEAFLTFLLPIGLVNALLPL